MVIGILASFDCSSTTSAFLRDKVPRAKLAAPGLSIRVKGMKGPISEGELPKCKEFGNKIATQIKA
ncbi:unnamed protein product [marine sediment metagenome]|uniref:Uncharacterized protein n=1 Tax=marine sediment metagenome TaxID=412755 RepID=X1Q3R3_9ZZZZ